ncbi:hypothetical protein [Streptomyces sp. NPDC008121]|uniref:BP74-related protein n=1 Tax=Streptomyces sp. NPDC008121 TaxID=3364809 RepID=UPI0036EADD9F
MRTRRLVLAAAAVTTAALTTAATAAASSPAQGFRAQQPYLITFEVGDGKDRYSVRTSDPQTLARAQELLTSAPAQGPAVPHGKIIAEPSPDNPGYDWHISPAGFHFADVGAISCDAVPQMVFPGTEVWQFGYYCPWSAKVAEIEPVSP